MAFVLVTVTKMANMWYVHASNVSGPVERVVSQSGAVAFAKRYYANETTYSTQLLVYDENQKVQEAWAIKGASLRKLELLLPPELPQMQAG